MKSKSRAGKRPTHCPCQAHARLPGIQCTQHICSVAQPPQQQHEGGFEQICQLETSSYGGGKAERITDREQWLLHCCKGVLWGHWTQIYRKPSVVSSAALLVQLVVCPVALNREEHHL